VPPTGLVSGGRRFNPPVGEGAPWPGPPGKAVVKDAMAKDPAPGVNQGGPLPGSEGEAAPGLQGREALATGDKRTLPVEGNGVTRFFCDVHRKAKKKAKNGEGYRITFTTDGITFKHVDSFTDIPAREKDKIYIDTLPLQHTDGAIGLLRRGVELYCLRRLTLVEKKRGELKLPKTTRGDIKTLMNLEERWFRKLSEDFLIMRRMISAYRSLQRTHQQLENKCKALSEAERYALKPAIKALEDQMNEMAKKIAEEAGGRYPAYNSLVEELGISGKVSAMEALAELMTYIDFVKSPLRGLKKLLGLYRPVRSKRRKYWRIYDGRLHQAVIRLAMIYYRTRVNGRQCWRLIRQIRQLLRANQTPG
jgi:hypothetical protein